MVDRSGLPVVLSYLTSELYDQLMTRDLRGGGGAVGVVYVGVVGVRLCGE